MIYSPIIGQTSLVTETKILSFPGLDAIVLQIALKAFFELMEVTEC